MSLKYFMVLMTFVAVVSDYLLHPFYPYFFESRFGVNSPNQVGYYFSSLCLMVMVAFPFWAYVSKKVAELNILIYTQLIAGILALYCYSTSSYLLFWTASLIMVFFKGSYLLIYPYTLKIVDDTTHQKTIGLLSVVVHLGGILGALIGGFVLDYISPETAFLVMAGGDFVQMGMSAYLLKSTHYNTSKIQEEQQTSSHRSSKDAYFILKLGLITMLLYFSDFLIRPFFTKYWEYLNEATSKSLTGFIYAIPGLVALLALYYNHKRPSATPIAKTLITALLLGMVGLILQGSAQSLVIIIGRIFYGWAIFHATVNFDVLLFETSTPEDYAVDYSKVHFMQSLGVLLASTTAGILVEKYTYQIPFDIALVGFTITLSLFVGLFRHLYKQNIPLHHV